jgi:hypothetical protein
MDKRWHNEIMNRCASIRKARDMEQPKVVTNRNPSIMLGMDWVAASSVAIASPPREIGAAVIVVVAVQDAFRGQKHYKAAY